LCLWRENITASITSNILSELSHMWHEQNLATTLSLPLVSNPYTLHSQVTAICRELLQICTIFNWDVLKFREQKHSGTSQWYSSSFSWSRYHPLLQNLNPTTILSQFNPIRFHKQAYFNAYTPTSPKRSYLLMFANKNFVCISWFLMLHPITFFLI
jgi:hypothetical protein